MSIYQSKTHSRDSGMFAVFTARVDGDYFLRKSRITGIIYNRALSGRLRFTEAKSLAYTMVKTMTKKYMTVFRQDMGGISLLPPRL